MTQRSAFVTAVAWIFTALAGFSTLIALLQNIMLSVMFSGEEFRAAAREAQAAQDMPAVFRFMFENFRYLFLAFLVLSATTLVSAIGLLLRKNWARLLFIGIMGLGILWNLSSLALPFVMSSLIPEIPAHAPPDFQNGFKVMWTIMTVFSVIIGLAIAAVLAWIIKRLVSEEIRREFIAP